MSEGTGPTIGLSVGATNLAAATSSRAATRRAVLTMFRHRAPEVGLPSENPKLDERGLILTDFVERVGDPVGIIAADGSVHRGETLLADALRAMAYTVADGRPITSPPTVTYPAHWRAPTVEALRRSLGRIREFGDRPQLISDAKAALVALQADPGVPSRGVIAVCDFGASGTNITLFNAAGLVPIGETVRHSDFSGDLIDQALLTAVVADLSTAGTLDVTSTSAIGSLGRLRAACRGAKERLSAATVSGVHVQLPGHSGEVRLTRAELDDAIAEPLDEFLTVVQDTLRRNAVHPADLVAVASVGGGAGIPVITTALSEHLRVPVITSRRAPALSAVAGAALWAGRGPEDDNATAMAPAAAASPFADADAASSRFSALAWSEDQSVPELVPSPDYDYHSEATQMAGAASIPDEPRPMSLTGARPKMAFAQEAKAAAPPRPARWYHNPVRVAVTAGMVLLAAGAGIAVALGDYPSTETPATAVTATTTTDAPPAPVLAEPAPEQAAQDPAPQAPVTQTVVQQQEAPAPAPAEPAPAEPAPAEPAPAPAEPAPAPVTETVTETAQAPATQEPPASQAPVQDPTQWLPPILDPFIPPVGGQ